MTLIDGNMRYHEFWARCLALGHFDTSRSGDGTGNLLTARRPLLAPEITSPYYFNTESEKGSGNMHIDSCFNH